MLQCRLAAAVGLSLLLGLPASAKGILDYAWIEVRTPHFVIASAQKPDNTLALAIELENFRNMAQILTNIARFEERIPTKIFLLPRTDQDLGFGGGLAGYFSSGMRANYAATVPSGSHSDEVLKHEYVHFLLHNRDRVLYPTWFDEGFADLLSTLRVKGTAYEFGKPDPNRISWLLYAGWLPYSTILQARDTSDFQGERAAMFYAQSWLLVHWMMIGNGDFSRRNGDFLRRREAGEAVADAFVGAFGIEAKALGGKLRRHLSKLVYYKGELRQPLPAVETQTRPLPRAEIAAALGTLALHVRGAEAAAPYYQAALDADSNYGPALTGVADIHKFAGRFDQALPLYERAIALEPKDANHELDFAEYFLDRARQEQAQRESAERVSELLVEARRHFTRAYKLNPDNPEILAMNGASYLVDGVSAAKGVASLEAAHRLLPGQTEIRLLLAHGYIAAGEPEKARSHLETLAAWTHSEGLAPILELLSSLDAVATDAESSAATGGNPSAE